MTERKLQTQCDKWNRTAEIGVPVYYRKDDGTRIATETRSAAYVLSGHTAVIFVGGISGCVLLDRVTTRQ